MATNKRAKLNSFHDIIDTEAAKTNSSIFSSYKEKSIIGKEIFKELYKRFNNDPDKGPIGFYMDNSKTIGILSQCQSLQALLLLASDFALTFDDDHIVDPVETNLTIRDIMDIVIEDIFRRIETKKPNVYRFDASPYETELFTVENSNIEAITWVIPCFLQALKYHASINETCKWEAQLVDVISYGIRYINDSFIQGESKLGESKKLEIGWNFTKNCQEPSLYYTFAVCECFVEFYSTFEDYLKYKEAERNNILHNIKIPAKLLSEKAKQDKEFAIAEAQGDRGLNEQGKQIAKHNTYNELFLRYKEINNGIEAIDDSIYGELESKCKSVAKEIWRLTNENLADKFFYNDLSTVLSEDDIATATTSDALFNTVYIINIMIDAGLDEEILLKKEIAENADKAFEYEQEYTNLLESCQLASQKALRSYEKLKNNGKEYIVEQFLIGFNEKFTVHKDLVRELRKRRMRVFTLIPLLIRTNNAISEYLIKYPQVTMKKYLGYILDNRYSENGEAKWIWENEGFFSASNYYYVSALGEFYAYYENYESKFIKNYNENLKQREAIIEQRDAELNAPDGTIGQLKKLRDDQKQEIKQLQNKLDNVETPVESAVAQIISREAEKLLPGLLVNFIKNAAKGLTVSDVDSTACKDVYSDLSDAIEELMYSFISEYVYDEIRTKNASKAENLKNHNNLKENLKKEIKRCIKSFIAEIKNSDDNRSSFYNQG